MSLYRAYRPQRFADIVGQTHVVRTISNAVAHGTVAHAYLFSGPRGIGKTSVARILAMAVNCSGRKKTEAEPCGSCTVCEEVRKGSNLNVVEIDAASNRGIDEIRTLKEGIAFAPSAGGTKVYIIDEVHMLTKEAFNALLKTLEEPPAHAIFVLATTELHRVPETIISRTQHFEFKRATIGEITEHLKRIAKEEKLTIDDEALGLMAIHADGGLRDALSLLDQLAALGEKEITAEAVRLILGIAPEAELIALLEAVQAGETSAIHTALERFATHGYDPAALTDALVGLVRQALWAAAKVPPTGSEAAQAFAKALAAQHSLPELADLISRLVASKEQLRWSPLPYLPLELALLAAQTKDDRRKTIDDGSAAQKSSPVRAHVAVEKAATVNATEVSTVRQTTPEPLASPVSRLPSTPSSKSQSTEDLPKIWKAVIEAVRTTNASLGALLRSAQLLELTDETGRIEVPFSFYADRIKDKKSMGIIAGAFATVVGSERSVQCVVAGSTPHSSPPASPAGGLTPHPSSRSSDDVARDIVDVFGTVEVARG